MTNQQQSPTECDQIKSQAEAPALLSNVTDGAKHAKRDDKPWYHDAPKVVGVLGFVLSVATLGERYWVREGEALAERVQQLRDVTGDLADIQAEYLEVLSKPQAQQYALGVAMNTKRQMHLQTARALLADQAVKRQATAQILGTLASQVAADGRYEEAKAFFEDALKAPGMDVATKPYIQRSLAILYRTPNTSFFNVDMARSYFKDALATIEQRQDDTGLLVSAETILAEGGVEVTYGELGRAKELAAQARQRLGRVRGSSPMKSQLEQMATSLERGQQYGPSEITSAQPAAVAPQADRAQQAQLAVETVSVAPPQQNRAVGDASSIVIRLWQLIPGQVSGAELELSIDGRNLGALSNLNDRLTLSVKLAAGTHQFALENLSAYAIDTTGGRTRVAQNVNCRGLFEIGASTTELRLNVGSGPNGLMCAIQ